MAYTLVTAPATEPLSLNDTKKHLRLPTEDDNDYLESLIQAAREFCENYTHRVFITQTWDLKMDGFPGCDAFCVDLPPLRSVTSISYVDTAGDTQTFSSSDYIVDAPAGERCAKGRIALAFGEVWPVTREQINAVTVRFVAGYGDAAKDVPHSVKAAMKLLIGNWYRNREAVAQVRGVVQELPLGVAALLWPLKAF